MRIKYLLISALFAICILLLWLVVQPAQAGAVLQVCSSCTHTTIQSAVVAANPGDIIEIRDAVHTENDITVSQTITIRGMGVGSTTLQGAVPPALPTKAIFHIVQFSGQPTPTVRFEGIRFRNAQSDFISGGGAILNDRSPVVVQDSQFFNSVMPIHNGGIMTLNNTQFYTNTGTLGGAINNYGVLTIENAQFWGNSAENGGAIYNEGLLTVQFGDFRSNQATDGSGGAIMHGNSPAGAGRSMIVSGTARVLDSAFFENSAEIAGGAISNAPGYTTTIRQSTFGTNSAKWSGGALDVGGDMLLDKSTLTANSTITASGAGVHVGQFVTFTATNSTFEGHTSFIGDGTIYSNEGYLTLDNVTIANNNVNSKSGLVLYYGTATVRNSIIANNRLGLMTADCDVDTANTTWGVSGQPNLSSDDSCPDFTYQNRNARLWPLQGNGSSTDTMRPDWDSPALNAGGTCLADDQRGVERSADIGCDLGAYEKIMEFACTFPNAIVPDNDTNGYDSIVSWPAEKPGEIVDVMVTASMTHTFVGDLQMSLLHTTSGLSTSLLNRPQNNDGFFCNGDNVSVRFSEGAANPAATACNATAPAVGEDINPSGNLLDYQWQSTLGEWTLNVADLAGGDIGRLQTWCVVLDYVPETDSGIPTAVSPRQHHDTLNKRNTAHHAVRLTLDRSLPCPSPKTLKVRSL